MKLINLGLLFSAAICANPVDSGVEVTTLSSNNTIMGSCFDGFNSYKRSESGPMIKGKKYRIGTIKQCGDVWHLGMLHWKAFHHGWPENPSGTWSWGISQDTECNAKFKSFVRLDNDGRMFDDEVNIRYAYTDDTGRPKQSDSAICSLVKCYNDLDFIPANTRFGIDGKIYNAYKWRKNSAASSRKFFDLKCGGDDVVSTGDTEKTFFFLLY
jgi:hypothetical protein